MYGCGVHTHYNSYTHNHTVTYRFGFPNISTVPQPIEAQPATSTMEGATARARHIAAAWTRQQGGRVAAETPPAVLTLVHFFVHGFPQALAGRRPVAQNRGHVVHTRVRMAARPCVPCMACGRAGSR